MTATAIFLSAMLATAVQGIYKAVTGKDLFPANPKGPLYKWFGDATHRATQERLQSRLHDLEQERLSSQLDRRPSRRLLGSEREK